MNLNHRSDLELLRCVIGTSEADRLYRGMLSPLFKPKEPGIQAHEKLAAAHELIRRWLNEDLQHEHILSSAERLAEYLRTLFARREYESLVALFLDAQCRLIATEEMSSGSTTHVCVYTRRLVKRALDHNAGSVILSHNHPDAPAEPTEADKDLTAKLKQALSFVEVEVLDHIVIGEKSCVSFVERGLL